jgi:glucosamine--fructose-6-phosphate aminotransferase (isomerizing)
VGSSISRESHAGAYTHAGPEIGVALKLYNSNYSIDYDRFTFSKAKGTLSLSDHMYLQELD